MRICIRQDERQYAWVVILAATKREGERVCVYICICLNVRQVIALQSVLDVWL